MLKIIFEEMITHVTLYHIRILMCVRVIGLSISFWVMWNAIIMLRQLSVTVKKSAGLRTISASNLLLSHHFYYLTKYILGWPPILSTTPLPCEVAKFCHLTAQTLAVSGVGKHDRKASFLGYPWLREKLSVSSENSSKSQLSDEWFDIFLKIEILSNVYRHKVSPN